MVVSSIVGDNEFGNFRKVSLSDTKGLREQPDFIPNKSLTIMLYKIIRNLHTNRNVPYAFWNS